MPQYMLALYDDPAHWPKLSPEEMQKSIERYMAWGKRPYAQLEDGGRIQRA